MRQPSNVKARGLPPRYWRLKPFQLAVIDLLDWLFPFIIINVLWVLLSLTLILLPAATASLYETVAGAYRNEPPDPRRFLWGMRRWIVKGWLWAGSNVVVLGALFFAARTVYANEQHVWLLGVIGVAAAMVVIGQMYFWPYVMLQEQPSLLRALRNSVFTVFGDLIYSALYLALTILVLVPAVVVVAPFLLIVPVLLAMLVTYGLAVWLQQHGILQGHERDV